MPRYRFHLFNDVHTLDDLGRDIADMNEARAYAIKCIRGIMADELNKRGQINLKHWMEIEDEQGDMHVVPFSEAVTIS